jgi:hypothetical protein
MMALYNDCIRERTIGGVSLPPGCEMRPWAMDNLNADAPLSQWAQGFGMGSDYLSEVWDAYTQDEFDEELGALLMTLTFFTSRNSPRRAIRKQTEKVIWSSLPNQ